MNNLSYDIYKNILLTINDENEIIKLCTNFKKFHETCGIFKESIAKHIIKNIRHLEKPNELSYKAYYKILTTQPIKLYNPDSIPYTYNPSLIIYDTAQYNKNPSNALITHLSRLDTYCYKSDIRDLKKKKAYIESNLQIPYNNNNIIIERDIDEKTIKKGINQLQTQSYKKQLEHSYILLTDANRFLFFFKINNIIYCSDYNLLLRPNNQDDLKKIISLFNFSQSL